MSKRVLRSTLYFLSFLSVVLLPSALKAQAGVAPLIRVGEELTFAVHSSRFGNMGTAVMRTVRDTVEGRDAYRLSFDFSGRVLLFKVTDRTRSWVDVQTLTTLRYQKSERSPVRKSDEDSRIHVGAGTWTDAKGEHALAVSAPLDELAYIYLVRGAASKIGAGGTSVNRHFDIARNEVKLTSLGPTRVAALGDTLGATIIQMDAKDSRQKSGTSRITFYVGNDAAHLLLRIDSSMPMAGSMIMTLKSVKASAALVAEQ